MHTDRLVLETDRAGNLKGIPKFPPNKKVEVTFSILDKSGQSNSRRRSPHRDIAGKTRLMGNIFDSVSEKEWDLPR